MNDALASLGMDLNSKYQNDLNVLQLLLVVMCVRM